MSGIEAEKPFVKPPKRDIRPYEDPAFIPMIPLRRRRIVRRYTQNPTLPGDKPFRRAA